MGRQMTEAEKEDERRMSGDGCPNEPRLPPTSRERQGSKADQNRHNQASPASTKASATGKAE